MPLFLTASFADVAHHLPACLAMDLTGKRVSFIPTACEVETVTFYMDNDRQTFDKLGVIIDELNLSQMSLDELAKKIHHNDLIFVGGGNTFYLLEQLQRTGLDQVISQAVKQGKPYIGTSAGSMVASPDISYVAMMDDKSKAPHLQSTKALSLTDICVLPHFNNAPFAKIAHAIYDKYHHQYHLIPLDNHQALWIDGNHQHKIG